MTANDIQHSLHYGFLSVSRSVGMLRLDQFIGIFAIFLGQTGFGQIAGDFHDRRINPVFILFVIVM